MSEFALPENVKMTFKFIPFSQSRMKNEKYRSFNYIVTVWKNDKEVLTTEYTMGYGHSPSYTKRTNDKYIDKLIENMETETGRQCKKSFHNSVTPISHTKHITPKPLDVWYSLLDDYNVLNYTFDDFCSEFGYSTDSIKAKETYDSCVKIAIQLKSFFGDSFLQEQYEQFLDY